VVENRTMSDRRQRFEAQVLPHLDAAYRFARWLGQSGDGAEDVVQEAFLRAFQNFEGLRSSDAKAWLMTIVRNCHLTAVQQRNRHPAVPLPDEEGPDGHALVSGQPDSEGLAIRHGEIDALERFIAELPDDFREVLVLREVEGLDYRQIAEVIQAPVGTVMSRLSRARTALRKRWLDLEEGEPGGLP
jgi:RNA polymerase sigma factor (sigma-70 family)